MKFTQTDYKQFVDEIYFLNKDKDFSGTFVDALKGTITIKDIDSILEEKRKGYNFALTNVFRKYNIVPDDLYDHLDRAWNEVRLIEFVENHLKKSTPTASVASWLTGGWLLPTLSIAVLGVYQYAVRTKWEGYKASALLFADEYAKGLVKNE